MKLHLTLSQLAQWILLTIVFLLPLQTRWIIAAGQINDGPWEYGTISFYGLDILVLLFLIATTMHVVEQKLYHQFSHSQLLAIFLIFVALFSMYFASNAGVALFWWVKLLEGAGLFILIPFLKIDIKKISVVFVVAAVIQALYGYTQFLFQNIEGNKWLGIASQNPQTLGVQVIDAPTGRILRAYGALPHPNMLAGFLVVAILLGLGLYLAQNKNLKRLPTAIALAVLSLGLWLTFSRQAWIALAITLVALIMITFAREKIFPGQLTFGIFFILIPLLSFSLIFSDLIHTRVNSDTRLEANSMQQRRDYLAQSMAMIKKEGLTGVGIGNYTAYNHAQDENQNITKQSYEYQPVHDIYLLIFSELGFFGLLAFLLLLCSLFMKKRNALAHAAGRPLNPTLALVWQLALLALLVIGLFDHYLWTLNFGILLFWITAGFAKFSR